MTAESGAGQAGSRAQRGGGAQPRRRLRRMLLLYGVIVLLFVGCFVLEVTDWRLVGLLRGGELPEPAVVPGPTGARVDAARLLAPPAGLDAEEAPARVEDIFAERFGDLGPFAAVLHRTYVRDGEPVAASSLLRLPDGGDGAVLRQRAAAVVSRDYRAVELVELSGREVVLAGDGPGVAVLWAPDPETVVFVLADDEATVRDVAAQITSRGV